MIRKKLLAGIMTAAMALTMCMGTGVTAFAAGDGNDPRDLNTKDASGAVTKNLIMDENVTTPAATFQFTIEKATSAVTDGNGEDVTNYLSTDGPELTIDPVMTTQEDTGTVENGIKTVSKEASIKDGKVGTLEADDFPHAGIYAYKIKEANNTYTIADPTKEKMTYSKAEYTVFITIINDVDGLKIDSIQGVITKDDAGTDITDKKVPSTEPGSSDLAFQNIYSKTGGTGEEGNEWNQDLGALSVSKEVTGRYGDQTAKFDFSLTLYKNATLDAEVAQSDDKTYPTYKVSLPDGSELSYQFDADTDEITRTFQLSHGQKITFTDVPVGTTYTLTENNGNKVTNYDTTISGKADGVEFTEKAMTVSNKLVGEDSNYADVENSYDENPITGIVSNNLPFIVLIGAAIAGFAAYLIIKRRRFVR